MSTPSILIEQTGQAAGTTGESRVDCITGSELQVTDTANTTGPWAWTVVTPADSAAVATGLDTNDVRITPDVTGTYLFFVVRNGTEYSYTLDAIGQKVTTQGGASVLLSNGRRIPAAGETQQFSDSFGWAEAMEDIIRNDVTLKEEDVTVTGGPFNKFNFKAIGGGAVTVGDAGSGEATVTISGGAGGGGSNLELRDEGVLLDSTTELIDFVGDGVTAVASGTGVRVSIPGGGGGGGGTDLSIKDEGTEVEAATSFIDFVGAGVTTTSSGVAGVRVEVPGSVVGALEFLDKIDVTSDTTDVDFGATGDGDLQKALDGDTDEEYVLSWYLNGTAASAVYSIQPNGISTNQYSAVNYGGTSNGSILYANLNIENGTSGTKSAGEGVLQALTGKERAWISSGAKWSSGSRWSALQSGGWTDTTTNITSLRIHCGTALGIKSGSHFVLWRRVRRSAGGANNLTVKDEGSLVSGTVNNLDFVGDGVTAVASGTGVRVSIPGGGSALSIEDEGTEVEAATEFIDFAGAGVTVTSSGINGVRVDVSESTAVAKTVLSSASSTITVTGLDGDADGEYDIELNFVTTGTSSHDIDIRPNGSTLTDRKTVRTTSGSFYTATTGIIAANGTTTTEVVKSTIKVHCWAARTLATPHRLFETNMLMTWNSVEIARWGAWTNYSNDTSNLTSLSFGITNVQFAAGSELVVRRVFK